MLINVCRSWARFVDRVIAAYNSKVHSTTNAKPDDVFYQQADSSPLTKEETELLFEAVRVNTIKRANADARRQFAQLVKYKPFQIGDLVFVYSPSKVKKRGPRSQYVTNTLL